MRVTPRENGKVGKMRWSLKIANIGGTELRVHVTFFLLLIWIAASSWAQGGGAAALYGVVFVCLIFLSVVLHEFGHAIAAQRYGIRTPDITLLPIGGLARLERLPERPGQELVVALAGPAVNVVIAAALVLLLGARFDLSDMAAIEAASSSLTGRIAAVNVMLVLFNLIPAFPLDGGRVLRALLTMSVDRPRATLIAARVGQAFALAFAAIGLMGNPFLVLISIFLFFAAEAESDQESKRALASRRLAQDAMVSRFEHLTPDSTAEDAGKLLLVTTQQEFPVLDRLGAPQGIVTRQGLIEALRETGPTTPVTAFMETTMPRVEKNAPLISVMDRLAQSASRTVAVYESDGRFVGYVSSENAAELFMLDEALGAFAAAGNR